MGSQNLVQKLPDQEVESHAEQFLSRYHTDKQIPVPIEELVEFDLHKDIVPFPGLHEKYHVDGFFTRDLEEIYVDQSIYEGYPGRLRFTLGHEIGHSILHNHIFKQAKYKNIEGWKSFIKKIFGSLSYIDQRRLEYQASLFAARVLIPKKQFEQRAERLIKYVVDNGIDLNNELSFGWTVVTTILSDKYKVPEWLVLWRLKSESLIKRLSKKYLTHKTPPPPPSGQSKFQAE